MYLKKLQIGNVTLENNIILAPMAGITDLPFRIICKNYGVGLACTEMVSSKALFYQDEKTKKLLNTKGEKRPISVQIFGNEIEAMLEATKYVNSIADVIDINMGCPAPKVVKNGDGSKLLLDLDKVGNIVETVVKQATHPVSVKIRKGWDQEHIVAVEVAKIIEQAGASMIAVHGRTREEYYSGKADWEIIRQVKESVKIPVIGNGDIIDEETAQAMFEKTGVDGIMIGRGSLGNPWIFQRILHFLETGEKLEEISLEEKQKVIKQHLEMEVQEKGEKTAVKEMRKQIAWYTKNLKNATKIREVVNQIESKEILLSVLEDFFKEQ